MSLGAPEDSSAVGSGDGRRGTQAWEEEQGGMIEDMLAQEAQMLEDFDDPAWLEPDLDPLPLIDGDDDMGFDGFGGPEDAGQGRVQGYGDEDDDEYFGDEDRQSRRSDSHVSDLEEVQKKHAEEKAELQRELEQVRHAAQEAEREIDRLRGEHDRLKEELPAALKEETARFEGKMRELEAAQHRFDEEKKELLGKDDATKDKIAQLESEKAELEKHISDGQVVLQELSATQEKINSLVAAKADVEEQLQKVAADAESNAKEIAERTAALRAEHDATVKSLKEELSQKATELEAAKALKNESEGASTITPSTSSQRKPMCYVDEIGDRQCNVSQCVVC